MGRLVGTVKWYSSPKGYGFVRLEDGREAFVHYSAIEGDGYGVLTEGESIECELVERDLGLVARAVVRTEREAETG